MDNDIVPLRNFDNIFNLPADKFYATHDGGNRKNLCFNGGIMLLSTSNVTRLSIMNLSNEKNYYQAHKLYEECNRGSDQPVLNHIIQSFNRLPIKVCYTNKVCMHEHIYHIWGKPVTNEHDASRNMIRERIKKASSLLASNANYRKLCYNKTYFKDILF